jgi:SET domain-containing protein
MNVPHAMNVALRKNGKGLGVYALSSFRKGDVIEDCPVLVGRHSDFNRGVLANYTFAWDRGKSALAMGCGSFYNHAWDPNATYRFRHRQKLIRIVARRPIRMGEEIFISYNGDPDDRSPVGFRVRS